MMDVKKAIRILEDSVGLGSSDLDQAIGLAVYELLQLIPRQPVFQSDGLGCCNLICPNCEAVVYNSDWPERAQLEYFDTHCHFCRQRFTPKGYHIGEWEPEVGEAD